LEIHVAIPNLMAVDLVQSRTR